MYNFTFPAGTKPLTYEEVAVLEKIIEREQCAQKLRVRRITDEPFDIELDGVSEYGKFKNHFLKVAVLSLSNDTHRRLDLNRKPSVDGLAQAANESYETMLMRAFHAYVLPQVVLPACRKVERNTGHQMERMANGMFEYEKKHNPNALLVDWHVVIDSHKNAILSIHFWTGEDAWQASDYRIL